MAKKEKVIVDEEMMRGIMMREVPVSELVREPDKLPATDSEEPPETDNVTVDAPAVAKKVYTRRKKREEPEGYAERFLIDDRIKNRVSTCISRDVYDRIRKFLPLIAPDVALTSYLNNIVADHLEQHWDEISELYNVELEKPL